MSAPCTRNVILLAGKTQLLTLRENLNSLLESVFLILFVFCVCFVLSYYVSLRSDISCCDVLYYFPHKNDIQFLFTSNLFVEGLLSYLCYLCLFTYSGIQHIVLCFSFVFLRLMSCVAMYPVSLNCPFLIGQSVFSIVNLHQLIMMKLREGVVRRIFFSRHLHYISWGPFPVKINISLDMPVTLPPFYHRVVVMVMVL